MSLGGTTLESPPGTIAWDNIKLADLSPFAPATLPSELSIADYNALGTGATAATFQSLYQKVYADTGCTGCTDGRFELPDGGASGTDGLVACVAGIEDTLRIFIHLVEPAPFGPMLIQAPVMNPTPVPQGDSQVQRPPDNPKTTIAAYGRKLAPTISPADWGASGPTGALPSIFVNIYNGMADGRDATYTYVPTTQVLHEDEIVTVTGFTGATASALNVTSRISNVFNLVANIFATGLTGGVLSVSAPNSFAPGMLVTLLGTGEPFLNGQTVTVTSAVPTGFSATRRRGAELRQLGRRGHRGGLVVPDTDVRRPRRLSYPVSATGAGLVTPTLQSAYYLSGGTGSNLVLGVPPVASGGPGATSGVTGQTGVQLKAGPPRVPWPDSHRHERVHAARAEFRRERHGRPRAALERRAEHDHPRQRRAVAQRRQATRSPRRTSGSGSSTSTSTCPRGRSSSSRGRSGTGPRCTCTGFWRPGSTKSGRLPRTKTSSSGCFNRWHRRPKPRTSRPRSGRLRSPSSGTLTPVSSWTWTSGYRTSRCST